MNTPASPVPSWFSSMYHMIRERYIRELRIVDEARFFDVMMADPKARVRQLAVTRLTDQALLRRAAEHDPDENVRAEAVKMLTDQSFLFAALVRDPSDSVRIAAAGALRDDALCCKAALKHPLPAVREAAAGNMTDQQLLARILRESEDQLVRVKAASRVTDPDLAKTLFAAMPPDREYAVTPRVSLVYALTDQAYLSDLALNDPDFKVRRAAASRLTDQDLLMRIIEDETEYDRVRAAAAGQITDQETLRNLANTYYHKLAPYDIGEEALKHIQDQQFLKSFAEDPGLMHCIRKAAAEHVTDQEILFDWAMNADNDTLHGIGLAGIALRRLENPEYLARVAVARVGAADMSERAIERLHDDRWLLFVINSLAESEWSEEWWIRDLRCSAALAVQDPSLLVDLALRECNDEYDISESFELDCIRSIAESPSAMHDYASRFTNPEAFVYAVDFTMSRRGLEGFLENPALDESDRESVRRKIERLSRLDEIGMAEKD